MRGNVPNFDIVSLLKGENVIEDIDISKVIDESQTWVLDLTYLDHCGNDPIIYIAGTNDMWTHNIHYVFHVHILYANEGVNLMLHHPSSIEIKS